MLKERQLDTEIRRPADAARYASEQEAQARKTAAVLDGDAEKARRAAAAEAVRREGVAEADAIAARGEAEAKSMQQKADAYAQYGDAAVLDLLARMLPELVKEAAAPMAAIDKVTVISTDGASQFTKSVAGNVTQGVQLAMTCSASTSTACSSASPTRAAPTAPSRLAPPAPAAAPPTTELRRWRTVGVGDAVALARMRRWRTAALAKCRHGDSNRETRHCDSRQFAAGGCLLWKRCAGRRTKTDRRSVGAGAKCRRWRQGCRERRHLA